MKKHTILFILLFISLYANSQAKFFMDLNGGIGFKQNSFSGLLGGNSNFETKVDIHAGLSLGYCFFEKCRVRVETKYIRIGYKQVYFYTFNIDNDLLSPEYSELSINNLSINLFYDYRLVKSEKFDFYISPGFKSQFVMSDQEKTIYPDRNDNNTDFMDYPYNKSIFGLGVGLVAKYKITEKLGIVLIPDGTIFFKKFFENDEKVLKIFSISLGLEFSF